jgi:hypothetical protein
MIPQRLENLAAVFWEEAGEVPPFPRDLEYLIACTKQVNIDPLPELSVAGIRQRLARFPQSAFLDVRDRRLNGCLVAFQGGGTIFVDAKLSTADRRVIVAHEFAHFLADYEALRRQGVRRIGPGVLKIFDGERSATPAERVEATLAGVDLGVHVHYMERAADGTYSDPINEVERRANQLGLELLAPWRQTLALLRGHAPLPAAGKPWVAPLVDRFGLPTSWATPFAEALLAAARARRSFSETLGL